MDRMKQRKSGSWLRRAMYALSALAVSLGLAAAPALAYADAPASDNTTTWVEDPVTFQADGMTIYGTYRHPARQTRPTPAALIIAGSGPTDRNGNTPLIKGDVGTLRTVAQWLSNDGVASLRYDKFGSGQTGVGPYAGHIQDVGIGIFEHESVAGLNFLASQPGVDQQHLGVFGHSEGALYALLLASGEAGPAPKVHALGLLEPLGVRMLDKLTAQLTDRLTTEVNAGSITQAQMDQVMSAWNGAVATLRTTGTIPANLPYGLNTLLSPAAAKYLYELDKYDPADVAAKLRPFTPVLTSCSDADIQVSCGDVRHLLGGVVHAPAIPDPVQLHGVDHVLKEDGSMTGANYGQPLPFSAQLQQSVHYFDLLALHRWW